MISNLTETALNAALQGGGTVTFATSGTIVLTNTITLTNTVILDGTNQTITISGGGTVQIFNITSTGQVTLRNLTFSNAVNTPGYAGGGYTAANGGAIFTQGTLNVQNCTFSDNGAIGGNNAPGEEPGPSAAGGAIYNSGSLSITNSSFVGNSAVGGAGSGFYVGSGGNGYGGAIYNAAGNVVLTNVSFSQNSARGASGFRASMTSSSGSAYGGALASSGGSIQGNNLQVSNNSAQGANPGGVDTQDPSTGGAGVGGAFYLAAGTASISNSIFSNDSAQGGLGNGTIGGAGEGGIVFSAASALFWNCSFENSSAEGAGGGEEGGYSSPAPALGGAIYNTGTMQVYDSIVSNNGVTGGYAYIDASTPGNALGGAIYNTGSLEIQATTLSKNSATGGPSEGPLGNASGGAIANTGTVQFFDTVLASNVTSGANNYGEEIYSAGSFQADANSTLVPSVTGTPPLTYQWQLNTNNVAADTNSVLNLGSVAFAYTGTYNLLISNSGGLVANYEEIVNQPLTISSVTPNVGPLSGGTSVTITGTGFPNGATVSFGHAAATSVTVVSATNITAVTPPGSALGMVNVVVTNTGMAGAVLANGFAYFQPPLAISSVTPNTGPISGGTTVAIAGTGFTNGATVYFGNTAATSAAVVSSTNITASTPPAGTVGAVNVIVSNAGFSPVVLMNGFIYSPTISGVSPNAGPITGGTSVTIIGSGFASNASIFFGGNAARGVSVVSASNITASTPASTSTGAVNVIVSNASFPAVMLTNGFTYLPAISIVSPATGPLNGGTSVTVNGSGFASGATVTFGRNAATGVIFVSATNLTAVTPPGSAYGTVNVGVTIPDFPQVVLTNGFAYVPPVYLPAPGPGALLGSGSNRTFSVNVGGTGESDYYFALEVSTDLVNWQTLQTNASPFTYTDTNVASHPRQFYRGVLEPIGTIGP